MIETWKEECVYIGFDCMVFDENVVKVAKVTKNLMFERKFHATF
jgi:hypothetical protein